MAKLVLLSGGLDSTAAMINTDADRALFVDYGQPATDQEEAAARRICERLGVPLEIVVVVGLRLGSMADPAGERGPRVVQARNAVLCSLAANQLEPGDVIVLGAHAGDAAAYADCRWPFIRDLGNVLTAAYGVRLEAPLLAWTKPEILAFLGREFREYQLCWSCYTPTDDGEPCGTCSSCAERCASTPP